MYCAAPCCPHSSEGRGCHLLQHLAAHALEGAETHRALHRAHRARQRMQRFSAMYNLSEGRQGCGENTLKWEAFVHASSPLSPQVMPPKCVLPMHTNSIIQPLHTVHTGHVSATFSVSIWCAGVWGVWEAGMHVPTLLR